MNKNIYFCTQTGHRIEFESDATHKNIIAEEKLDFIFRDRSNTRAVLRNGGTMPFAFSTIFFELHRMGLIHGKLTGREYHRIVTILAANSTAPVAKSLSLQFLEMKVANNLPNLRITSAWTKHHEDTLKHGEEKAGKHLAEFLISYFQTLVGKNSPLIDDTRPGVLLNPHERPKKGLVKGKSINDKIKLAMRAVKRLNARNQKKGYADAVPVSRIDRDIVEVTLQLWGDSDERQRRRTSKILSMVAEQYDPKLEHWDHRSCREVAELLMSPKLNQLPRGGASFHEWIADQKVQAPSTESEPEKKLSFAERMARKRARLNSGENK